MKNWRRSLTVSWSAHFAVGINWDLHSALGVSVFFLYSAVGNLWDLFSFPHLFDALFILDPARPFYGPRVVLASPSCILAGSGGFTEALWSLLGLVPAVLQRSAVFSLCCRRMIFKKPSNPNAQSDQ